VERGDKANVIGDGVQGIEEVERKEEELSSETLLLPAEKAIDMDVDTDRVVDSSPKKGDTKDRIVLVDTCVRVVLLGVSSGSFGVSFTCDASMSHRSSLRWEKRAVLECQSTGDKLGEKFFVFHARC
jgi:hypothetical protein